MTSFSVDDLLILVSDALTSSGASQEAARIMADTMVRSEAEGNRICGLHYVPILCEQLRAGRIDGDAKPIIKSSAPAAICVDAAQGFAHVAIDAATPRLIAAARQNGIAALSVYRSTNALALSHLVTPLADAGLVGFAFANAPASIAPPGGAMPTLGTNPLAMAVPGPDGPVIVIDQSSTAVTKTKIIMHKERGEPIPLGWAFDKLGKPTTDPQAALEGSMAPAGGHKGFGVALIVEAFAVLLTGAQPSADAAPFFGTDGPPAGTGQFLLAINPAAFNPNFGSAAATLMQTLTCEPTARLPGMRRRKALAAALRDGVQVEKQMIDGLRRLTE